MDKQELSPHLLNFLKKKLIKFLKMGAYYLWMSRRMCRKRPYTFTTKVKNEKSKSVLLGKFTNLYIIIVLFHAWRELLIILTKNGENVR